jgi:hypothetical protein
LNDRTNRVSCATIKRIMTAVEANPSAKFVMNLTNPITKFTSKFAVSSSCCCLITVFCFVVCVQILFAVLWQPTCQFKPKPANPLVVPCHNCSTNFNTPVHDTHCICNAVILVSILTM